MNTATAWTANELLPEEETKRLLAAAQDGDFRAREQLVQANTRLVASIARRFIISGRDLDDLFQAGCIGLLKAIDRFDFSYQVCFSTYAVPLIMGEIRRMLRDDSTVAISRILKERAQKLESKRRELYQQWGAEPELWQLAEACDMTDEQALEALEAVRPPLSISETRRPEHGGSLSLADTLADLQADFDESLTNSLTIQKCIDELPPRLATVVRGRYFKGMTQSELAKKMGISQVQVSRLEKQALSKMKEFLTVET